MGAIQKTIQRTLRNKRNQRRFEPVLPQVEYKPKFRVGLAPFVPTKITFPDAMVVEGAGSTRINGTYLRDGDVDNKPAYQLVGGENDVDQILAELDGIYEIQNRDDFTSISIFYVGQNVATPDLVSSWTVDGSNPDASAPAPTVRRATWADIDAAGIDRSTVPLLE